MSYFAKGASARFFGPMQVLVPLDSRLPVDIGPKIGLIPFEFMNVYDFSV